MATHDIDNVEVGARIKSLREQKGYKQELLAEMVDLSSVFISEIELGKKGISANSLMRLSKALDASADYILFGKGVESIWMKDALEHIDSEDAEAVEQLLLQALKIIKQRPKE